MPVRNWFTFLMKGELKKPMKKPSHRWVIDESKCMSTNEVCQLRSTASKGLSRIGEDAGYRIARRWFMIELGLQVGLRVSEMASLSHKDLHLDGERSSIVVIGKGNKKRAIWIGSAFKNICKSYLAAKRKFGLCCDPDEPVLCSSKGKRLNKRTLQKDFKRLIKESCLPLYYYIHCLRHTYTTFLLRASQNNYRFAQQQLGHSSIRTTQVYAAVVESDGRRALEQLYQ